MHRNMLAAAAAIVLLTACTQNGAVYQAPIAQVRQTLMATGLPPQVFGSEEPLWEVQDGASEITWIVRRGDAELFRYIAHLTEVSPTATRVQVELKGADGGPAQGLAQHPEVKDMYLVAINERIASALEHRDFDMTRIYPSMTAAMIVNMGAISRSADEAAAASEKEARDNIAKAYQEEAEGKR